MSLAKFDIFPDAELLGVAILRAEPSFVTADMHIGTKLPDVEHYPALTIVRVGGIPIERHRLDHANMQVDIWAETKQQAHDLSQKARAVLFLAEGQTFTSQGSVLTGVDDALGTFWNFDSINLKPRYTFGVYFTLHAL